MNDLSDISSASGAGHMCPPSSDAHRQSKRARVTPGSDHLLLSTFCANEVKEGFWVDETRPLYSSKTRQFQDISIMSRTSNSPIVKSTNETHELPPESSSIITSRYSEAEMAQEPLLGVASFLNCTPAALGLLGGAPASPDLTTHTIAYPLCSRLYKLTPSTSCQGHTIQSTDLDPGDQDKILRKERKSTMTFMWADALIVVWGLLLCAEYGIPTESVQTVSEGVNGLETPQNISSEISSQQGPKASDPTLFLWDLDETLIIFQTLSNGRYAELFKGSKDPRVGSELGRRWEQLILDVCDDYFFYKQVEDYNEPNLMSLQDFDDGADLSTYDFTNDNFSVPIDAANKRKLAYRHRYIGDLYSKGLENLLTPDQKIEWQNLYEATNKYTDGWLSAGRALLEECQLENQKKRKETFGKAGLKDGLLGSKAGDSVSENSSSSNYNVLVTSGTLVPSLVKCLLFRLDWHFHHLNIYSSREVGKLQCFYWIKERVARPPLRYCVVGDGIDECEAAHILSWPFVKINMGPYAVHRLPAVSMDVLDDYMKVVYGPPDRLPAAVG